MAETLNPYQEFLAEAKKRGDKITIISGEELARIKRSINEEIRCEVLKIRNNCNSHECLIPIGGNFGTVLK